MHFRSLLVFFVLLMILDGCCGVQLKGGKIHRVQAQLQTQTQTQSQTETGSGDTLLSTNAVNYISGDSNYLLSTDGNYKAIMQNDGNFEK